MTGVARGLVDLSISPWKGGSPMTVSALVLPRLTLYSGGFRTTRRAWAHLDGLELADPEFLASDPVDLLLGADVCADILQEGLRRGGPQEPVAQQTTLGWILSGTINLTSEARCIRTHQCHGDADLPDLVQRFWRQEEVNPTAAPLSADELEAEDHFVRTHYRNKDGRYVVRLPLKSPLSDLTATRRSAVRLLEQMERRFAGDTQFGRLYRDFMREYEVLGHMSPAPPALAAARPGCFLPHHGVRRESSSSTKLRVVFNGSSRVPSGESLNQRVRVGPNLLPALADVLLRWRVHRYVLTSDVEKMYRQILVDPADRHLQQILWRHDSQTDVQAYTLNTVTYGLACAPFLAMRALRQLADDEEARFPRGSAVLRRDVYMDDILTGASSIADAKDLQIQLQNLCMAGGFPLRKWSANDPALLADIPPEHRTKHESLSWQPQECHATLGLQWHPRLDCFSFSTRAISVPTYTKRSVLSLTARLFDPLGWLAPSVIRAKILFQSTWLQGIDWDTPLDEASVRLWRAFQEDLPRLEEIRVPRYVHLEASGASIELHGFADASERAYAAVVYIRTETCGRITVELIAAKTKVAPIKQVTLPRLELCASTLLVRLAAHVQHALGASTVPVHLWSDSTVALGWIRGHPTRWKTYVANRVAEVQSTLPEAQWHHLPGTENPADCASRGTSPSELVSHPLWWQGPPWLKAERSSWPAAVIKGLDDSFPEERTRSHAVATQPPPDDEPDELRRFSSLNRLLRVTAWCRRWLLRRDSTQTPTADKGLSPPADVLTAAEYSDARLAWIRVVQSENFKTELTSLSRGAALTKKNALIRLTPFVDPQGILRVGGRIKHALLAFDERHPAILPQSSHFTWLVVEACHRRTLHGGVQLTLGSIRQRYWIPQGRRLVKAVIQR
ncbi:gag-pol polyprotein precursor, partial [Lasius niger]